MERFFIEIAGGLVMFAIGYAAKISRQVNQIAVKVDAILDIVKVNDGRATAEINKLRDFKHDIAPTVANNKAAAERHEREIAEIKNQLYQIGVIQ